MKIAFILGTRPEIIKLYSLIKECQKKKIDFEIIHTNQHYDEKMDRIFFEQLDLPCPNHNLKIGSGSHGDQTGRMMIEMEKVLKNSNFDVVLVQGDTNTVMAGALVVTKLGIKVGHVEAGLRSYDRSMPEEINRIVTDHVADWSFCPTVLQKEILLKEGIEKKKIFVTGNTIVDAVQSVSKIASKKSDVLKRYNLEKDNYFLLTCHRPANTDNEVFLNDILEAVDELAPEFKAKVIFPVHPRLSGKRELIDKFKNIITTDPLGYLDLIQLQKNAQMIFTDSGGIQEEACILQKKCVILRTNTERPETLKVGGAVILNKIEKNEIKKQYKKLMNRKVKWSNPFGDGKAAGRILGILGRGYRD